MHDPLPPGEPRAPAADVTLPEGAEPDSRAARDRIGRYRLICELGRGGMGVVYLAHDEALDRLVALKRLMNGAFAKPSDLERFEREARVAARVQHPGLVRVHDLDTADGEPFYTMDLVRGRALRDHLIKEVPWEPRRAAQLIAAVARALGAAHDLGLIHRDVKPENILVRDEDGAPLLADFGIARAMGGEAHSLTGTGEMLGTPAYMSPEQAMGRRDLIGPATDIYSLGTVLYELLAGRKAYPGSSVSVLRALMSGPPTRLPSLRGDAPLPLIAICERAMARDPGARYATAAELAEDLERFLDDQPVAAMAGRWRLHLSQAMRGRVRQISVVGTLVALVLLGLGVQAWRRAQAEARRQTAADERLAAMESRLDALMAEGRRSEAETMQRAFVELPENRGTAALTRAWIHQGWRLQEELHLDEARSAFASAYTSAERPQDQDEALLALARAFASEGRWPALSASLEKLRARPIGADALADLEVSLALGRRDLVRAAEVWPADSAASDALGRSAAMRALLLGLTGATAVPVPLDFAAPVPQGFGPPGTALLAFDSAQRRYVLFSSTLNELAAYPFPGAVAALPQNVLPLFVPGEPIRLLVGFSAFRDQPQHSELWTLEDQGVQIEARWPGLRFMSGVTWRTPWGVEMVGGEAPYDRDLTWIRRGADGGWRLSPVSPAVTAAQSDVHHLAEGDMDGDGDHELVVALGAWQAMDLRVLHAGAGPGAAPLMLGRSRIGVLSALAVLPRAGLPDEVVAWRKRSPVNASVFGADPSPPPEQGLFAFSMNNGALQRRTQRVIGQWSASELGDLSAADLDGDGAAELVARDAHAMAVLHRAGPDAWTALGIPGVRPLTVLDLDGDPAPEVLVRVEGSAEAWVLGMGDDRLPIAAVGELPTVTVPPFELSDPALAAGEERALQIARLGLDRDAAEFLERLASVAADADDQAVLSLLAGQLWESAHETSRAAVDYAAAADQASTSVAALSGLVRVLDAGHRFSEAVRANERLAQTGDPDAVATARGQEARLGALAGVDSAAFDLRIGLPPELEIDDPLAARIEAGRGLVVQVPAWSPAVARIPLQCSGPRVGIEAEFRVTSTEWASGVTMAFAAPGGGVEQGQLSFTLSAGGGGGTNKRQVDCVWASPVGAVGWQREPLESWSDPDDLVVMVDIVQQRRTAVCQAWPQGAEPQGGEHRDVEPYPSGQVDLVIGGAPWMVADPAQVARIELQRLEIRGCTPRPSGPSNPAHRASWALASGDSRAALEQFRAISGDTGALGEAAALLALGRVLDAAQAAARYRGDEDQRVWLLRQAPTLVGPLLAQWGPSGLRLLLAAASTNAQSLPVEPSALALLSTVDLSRIRPDDIGADGVQVLRALYAARGRAALLSGDLSRASADIDAALALPAPRPDPENLGARLLEQRVVLLLRAGDAGGALEAARRAVAASEAPEITQDRLANRVEVVPHLQDPAWKTALGR